MREIPKLEKRNRKLIEHLWRLEEKNNNLKNRVDLYKPIKWAAQYAVNANLDDIALDDIVDMQNDTLIKATCDLYDP